MFLNIVRFRLSLLVELHSNALFPSQSAGDQRLRRSTRHTSFNLLSSGVNFTKHSSTCIEWSRSITPRTQIGLWLPPLYVKMPRNIALKSSNPRVALLLPSYARTCLRYAKPRRTKRFICQAVLSNLEVNFFLVYFSSHDVPEAWEVGNHGTPCGRGQQGADRTNIRKVLQC